MTPLRKDFLSHLQIRHLSPRTIVRYEKIVEELAFFHDHTPLGMKHEDIQSFLFYCVNTRKFAPATTNQYIAGLKTFYSMMEPNNHVMDDFSKLRLDHKIPHLLARSEVGWLLGGINNIKHRMAIALMYGSGVRVSECVAVKISHIESSRKMLRVENGKGRKDRYTILSSWLIDELRDYYRACRPRNWLFENRSGKPLSTSTISAALKNGAKEANITKRVYPHILRHCFATHLLEQGVPLTFIQRCLGHKHLKTTCTYAHVTETLMKNVVSPLDLMWEDDDNE